MQTNNTDCKNTAFCGSLLYRLQIIEEKCDKIIYELSLVERLIIPSTTDVDALISSMRKSANDLLEQSIEHRNYVERCTDGSPMHLKRR